MEQAIHIADLFNMILKRWKLIVFTTIASLLAGAAATFYLITPMYQASAQILVNQKDEENFLDSNKLNSNMQIINTYREIIKSPIILEKVIAELELEENVNQLNRKISVDSRNDSLVFSVIVEDERMDKAVEIANTVSEVFQKEIHGIMNVDNVSILTRASMEDHPSPIKPLPAFNMTVAFVAGFLAGVILAIVLEVSDWRFKSSSDVEKLLGAPLLGAIENIPEEQVKKSSLIYARGGKEYWHF